MKLNTIAPNPGAKKAAKRLGRGIGSGFGKTSGKGHKGLKARSGGKVRVGFEGGQMPLKQRLPKFGFTSRKEQYAEEITLTELNKVNAETVNLQALKESGIIKRKTKSVKIILSGKIESIKNIENIKATAGARKEIEAAGGKITFSESL